MIKLCTLFRLDETLYNFDLLFVEANFTNCKPNVNDLTPSHINELLPSSNNPIFKCKHPDGAIPHIYYRLQGTVYLHTMFNTIITLAHSVNMYRAIHLKQNSHIVELHTGSNREEFSTCALGRCKREYPISAINFLPTD